MNRPPYTLFAELLDYPSAHLADAVHRCGELVESAAAQGRLERFEGVIRHLPLASLEETYTAVFDLRPDCSPYAGHLLYADGWRRSRWLASLNAQYRAHGFSAGTELPDHVGVMLRFLDLHGREASGEAFCQGLLGSIPILASSLEKAAVCYEDVVRALQLVLNQDLASKEEGTVEQMP